MSMRIGTAQPAQRLIDFNIRDSAKGLATGESNGGTIVAAEPRQSSNRSPPEEITRRCNGVLTVGAEQFQAADALLKEDKTAETVEALTKRRDAYPGSWIDRVAAERIERKTL
ncbi:MAG: hypothetical protein HOL51_18755 [Gemmatimonadetes bacterium]|jgi:hypothetical protein|nr:hypothetical protein [Gemmatimonadota bacterium]MBT5328155.1 hypothetical protein [Gemmatimonadota bacterium]MBT5805486.1 hypothetical protein [Gemmatimonadota bacterium]MBT6623020.1 hypothetical protein [Gemmatimonadota bacterium]MBT6906714.1 hypothetical protein [Gemmatimonadota bacterium]